MIRSTPRSRQRAKGFTLLEVMISLGIFTVGMLGLVGMQVVAIKGNRDADRLSSARWLAEQKIDTLLALPFTDTDLADTNATNNTALDARAYLRSHAGKDSVDITGAMEHYDPQNLTRLGEPMASDPNGSSFQGFQRFWNIADVTTTSGGTFKHLTVIVRFFDTESGEFRTFSLSDGMSEIGGL